MRREGVSENATYRKRKVVSGHKERAVVKKIRDGGGSG